MNINRRINSKSMKQVSESIKPLLDIQTLDLYCRYVISSNKNIRINSLSLIRDLFNRIDISTYGNDIERIKRIEFVKRGLEARLVKKLTEKDLIIKYINGGIADEPLLDTSLYDEISDDILIYLTEQAGELVKSYFVDDKYDQILSLATNLKTGNYTHRAEVVQEIQKLTSDLNLQFNKMDDSVSSSQMFTLVPGEFEMAMGDIYARETNPSKILKTGMTGLNLMLNGGFHANRVYLFLAQAAGGKSFTMLDLAMQIKKYNKNYVPHDPTKIPTIVFLTMENSEDENISRMMCMISNGKTFNDYDLFDSMEMFRSNGLGYSKEDPIDIIMIYKANLSVNTDYMYALVDKLRDIGREPICFFQDHIKRIRPVNKRNDLRLDLGEIVNEFKAFANEVGIPVITNSHLNRDASKTLDESTSSNKKDLIRALGSSNVSESFLMVDNCDVGIIINKERDTNDLLHMGFKCIKTRTRCDLELFYQPYPPENPIKLIEDVELIAPAFRRSLKDDMQPSSQFRFSRRNDFVADDDDELFTESVMNGVINNPVETVLQPSNAQTFIIAGQPSIPIFPVSQEQLYYPSAWEQNIINQKYYGGLKPGIIMYNNGQMILD